MTAAVLSALLGKGAATVADAQSAAAVRRSFHRVVNALAAAGVVKQGLHHPKRPPRWHPNTSPAELARLLAEAVARVERAEGGSAE